MDWRNCLALVTITLAALALAACTSSFSARKLGPEGKVGDLGGIPYTMTKPEFRIAETIKNGAAAYELQVAPVPDPENRYTIRASPSLFADTDFSVALNERGGLDASKLVATDRVTPMVTALGTFVVGALTVAAAFDPDNGLAKVLLGELEKPSFRCPNDPSGTNRNGLIAFIKDVQESSKDEKTFRENLHARTLTDHNCLAALPLEEAVKSEVEAILKLPLPQWRARHLAYVQRRVTDEVYRASLEGADPERDRVVRQLRIELARTVGEEAAQRRLLKIEDQLDLVPPRPSGDSSAYAEYARMRDEARLLREQITAAVGSTLAAVKPSAPEPFVGVVPRVPPKCVASASIPANCPKTSHVIVLERVEEARP